MEQTQYNQLFSFIWNIANDVLVNAFYKGDYKKIILPMMVLRRLDILLEPTHDQVLKQKEVLSKLGIPESAQDVQLYSITGYPFCNTSRFTKYFYKPVQLRSVHDIVADITGIEQETDGLLEEILSVTK